MRIVTTFVVAALVATSASLSAQQGVATAKATTAPPAPSTIKTLSRAEFDALTATPSRLLIIDVRRPDELTTIGGYPVYLSIQVADVENRLAWIPKDRAIVTVSNHATRAIKVAESLKAHGFTIAGAIGAQNYEEAGGALVKIVPPVKKDAATPANASGTR